MNDTSQLTVAGLPARLEALEPRRLLAATLDLSIDPSTLHQEWEGFGGSVSSHNGSPYNNPEFYNLLVGDAGINAVRLPVHFGFEESNDNDDPNVIDWDAFNYKAMDITLKFAQEMQKRGADTFLASLWTPPWWMKATSAHVYGGPLRADMREEFAEFVAAYVIAAKRDYGIEIDVFSIQNEPQFIQPYESTIYTPEQMISVMKAVQKRLAHEGLDTKVMAPEELALFDRWLWWDEAFREDPEIWNSDMVWGTHYAGGEREYEQIRNSSLDSGNPVWLTEAAGKHDSSWNGGLRLSEDIASMMQSANISMFYEWQLENFNDPTSALFKGMEPTTRYQAVKHYAHWIRPGARRMEMTHSGAVDVDGNKQRDLYYTSWYHDDLDAQSIVLTNNYTQPVTFNVTIAGSRDRAWQAWQSTSNNYFQEISLPAGSTHNQFQLTLPARSMVTLYDGAGDPLPGLALTSARPDQQIVYARDIEFGHAVRRQSLQADIINLRMSANASNIHEEFVNGRDAIFAAAASPERTIVSVIEHLLSLGADVNKRDNEGITPLMVAASTPMMWFSTQTQDPTLPSKKLGALLDGGAEMHAKDDMGRTPLHWGAQVPFWMYTPPFPQEDRIIAFMLERGADRNKVDRFGMTPLMWAQQEGNYANAAVIAAWNQDTAAPEVLDEAFEWDERLAVTLDFDEAMSAFDGQQLAMFRTHKDGTLAEPAATDVALETLDAGNTRAVLTPGHRLENGYYRVTVQEGQAVRDAAGNAMATGEVIGEFWFLNADANRDGRVNAHDYGAFQRNFGKSGVGFSGGDFDYDGRVTLRDFMILRQNYGLTIDGIPDGPPDGDPPLPGADPPPQPSMSPPLASRMSGGGAMTGLVRGASGLFRDGGAISLLSGDDDDERPLLR